MNNIRFTKHAEQKFKDLRGFGVIVTRVKIKQVLTHPIALDRESNYPNLIATAMLDVDHVLRVVYREEGDRILIITFYPGAGERYL